MRDKPHDFTMIPNWVIRDSVLTGNELLVLMALWSRMKSEGLRMSWPSKRLLAAEAHMSEASVKRTIPALEARGLITVQVRPRGDGTNLSNLYHLPLLPWDRPKPGQPYHYLVRTVIKPDPLGDPLQDPLGEGVTVNPPGGQGDPREGVSVTHEEDTHEENTREENMRSELPFRRDQDIYSLNAPEPMATPKQMSYVRDLYIQHNRTVPAKSIEDDIRALSGKTATNLIRQYLQAIKGRGGMYDGVEEGTPEYDALSPQGQAWADEGMLPPDYWVAFEAPPAARKAS